MNVLFERKINYFSSYNSDALSLAHTSVLRLFLLFGEALLCVVGHGSGLL